MANGVWRKKNRSVREVHAPKEVLETRVGAHLRGKAWVKLPIRHARRSLHVPLFKPLERAFI
jgi:hypothetical protein